MYFTTYNVLQITLAPDNRLILILRIDTDNPLLIHIFFTTVTVFVLQLLVKQTPLYVLDTDSGVTTDKGSTVVQKYIFFKLLFPNLAYRYTLYCERNTQNWVKLNNF